MASNIELNFEKINKNILVYFQNNDDSLLHEAKELFSAFIDSNRQLRAVKNIEQLLKLLKRRGLYGAHEFNTLKMFKKIIVDENFTELVINHQSLLMLESQSEEALKNCYGIYQNLHLYYCL